MPVASASVASSTTGTEPAGRRSPMSTPPFTSPPRFAHDRLDAYLVAREAIARSLPRGHATLADQLRRALLSTHLGIAEAAARSGADRAACFRCARGEASEAAAALDAVLLLGLAPPAQVDPVVVLLGRSTPCSLAWRALGGDPRAGRRHRAAPRSGVRADGHVYGYGKRAGRSTGRRFAVDGHVDGFRTWCRRARSRRASSAETRWSRSETQATCLRPRR
jgi:four helix bundle protein